MISYPSDLAHNLLFSTNRECLAIATSIMGMLTHNFHLSFRTCYKIFFKILIINVFHCRSNQATCTTNLSYRDIIYLITANFLVGISNCFSTAPPVKSYWRGWAFAQLFIMKAIRIVILITNINAPVPVRVNGGCFH